MDAPFVFDRFKLYTNMPPFSSNKLDTRKGKQPKFTAKIKMTFNLFTLTKVYGQNDLILVKGLTYTCRIFNNMEFFT